MAGVVEGLSGTDPAQAAEVALARLPAGPERDTALLGVAGRWAETEPESVAEWLAGFPPGHLRQDAFAALASVWAAKDSAAAAAWFSGQTALPNGDQMMSRVAPILADYLPETAARLVAESIAPGDAQNEAALFVVQSWAAKDLTAAAEWVGRFPPGSLRDQAQQILAEAEAPAP
jgi:hypothetical protein